MHVEQAVVAVVAVAGVLLAHSLPSLHLLRHYSPKVTTAYVLPHSPLLPLAHSLVQNSMVVLPIYHQTYSKPFASRLPLYFHQHRQQQSNYYFLVSALAPQLPNQLPPLHPTYIQDTEDVA